VGRNRGFTIVEVLIASLLALAIASTLLFSLSLILKSWSNFAVKMDCLESSRISMIRIVTDVRGAGIDPQSTALKLVLNLDDKVVSYDYKNGKVRRRVGGGSAYLTEEGRISSLRFSYPDQGLVKIEIGILGGSKLFTTEVFSRRSL
jgi:Tfp pilus assembly protein PilW